MKYSIKLHTIKSAWSIVYIEGSQVILSKTIVLLSLKINFFLANSADPDEMPHNAAFHLDLHCLQRVSSLKRIEFGIYLIILNVRITKASI